MKLMTQLETEHSPGEPAVSAFEADIPTLGMDGPLSDDEVRERMRELAEDHWIARTPLGFIVLRYDDVLGVLRDKRWHSAAAKVAEMAGITDAEFLENRRVSILSAEGDVHLMHTSTPRAVLFSSLTTIGSFCALALSSHPGTASMGALLTIAIGLTMLTCLIVLPALFALAERGRLGPA